MRIQTYIVESTPSKNFFQMSKVIRSFLGMGRKVIQVSLYNMSNVMKSVVHSPLKSCSSIIQTEWEFTICKCAPRIDEGSFMLVVFFNCNLVIAWESIHEGKRFAPGTIVENLIYERCRIIVIGTRGIQISIINTNLNGALFLSTGTWLETHSVKGTG